MGEQEEMTDAQLVEDVLVGDTDSFDLLMARYQHAVFNYLFYLTRNHERAEDLVQETFIRAYQSLKSLRNREKFKPWLFRIATNLFKSHYRKWILRPFIPLPDSYPSAGMEDPEESIERLETQMEVQKALSSLPESARSVLLLREMEGMSYEEIAESLNLSIGTVKSRIARARQNLARLLGYGKGVG